ncbi:MAG: putative transposase YbfD/YdcC [Maribacter sp.]|jgi:predicted transposase YbfD/YdcC
MDTQTQIASQIIDSEANYVLGLKGNQGILEEEVRESFEKIGAAIHANHDKDIELGHGRIEYRNCYAIGIDEYLGNEISDKWKGFQTMVMVDSKVEYKNGRKAEQIMEQKRFYISSLPPDAKKFNRVIRSH